MKRLIGIGIVFAPWIILGIAVWWFCSCTTSPDEPPCSLRAHVFSHDSGRDTVVCVNDTVPGNGFKTGEAYVR